MRAKKREQIHKYDLIKKKSKFVQILPRFKHSNQFDDLKSLETEIDNDPTTNTRDLHHRFENQTIKKKKKKLGVIDYKSRRRSRVRSNVGFVEMNLQRYCSFPYILDRFLRHSLPRHTFTLGFTKKKTHLPKTTLFLVTSSSLACYTAYKQSVR